MLAVQHCVCDAPVCEVMEMFCGCEGLVEEVRSEDGRRRVVEVVNVRRGRMEV